MKQTFIMAHDLARRNAVRAVEAAPDGYMVQISEPTRSLLQNSRLWAMLADVSKQVDWYGSKLTSEEWKHVFSAALQKQKVVPGIDGGFVVLGISTSKMTKKELSDLLDLIYAFGSERNVIFRE